MVLGAAWVGSMESYPWRCSPSLPNFTTAATGVQNVPSGPGQNKHPNDRGKKRTLRTEASKASPGIGADPQPRRLRHITLKRKKGRPLVSPSLWCPRVFGCYCVEICGNLCKTRQGHQRQGHQTTPIFETEIKHFLSKKCQKCQGAEPRLCKCGPLETKPQIPCPRGGGVYPSPTLPSEVGRKHAGKDMTDPGKHLLVKM